MGTGLRFAGWFLAVSPLQALLVVSGGLIAVGIVVPIHLFFFAHTNLDTTLIAYTPLLIVVWATVWLGYPLVVVANLARSFGMPSRVKLRLVAGCVVGAVTAYLYVGTIMFSKATVEGGTSGDGIIGPLGLAVWICGVLCPLYVVWMAARELVLAEEHYTVAFDRVIGTFLLFYFLPFGIYFLHRRILRLCWKSGNRGPVEEV